MANYNDQIERMKGLMGYGKINENSNHTNGAIEYYAKASDGKTYGIIRENTKYYIKTTTSDKETLAESYDYIGGWCNRKNNEYTSYANALKQFQLKMMSINEAVGVHTNVQALNPDKKEELVIEGTDKMRKEIARQRQIMLNAGMSLNEESSIGFKNTGVPEAPKTANGLPKDQSQPYTEKGEAKLDKDLTATATNPEKQGAPFEENGEVTDKDMQSDKNPKGGDDELEDAKYVPDNSVANQKPSGGKVVKVNEELTKREGPNNTIIYSGKGLSDFKKINSASILSSNKRPKNEYEAFEVVFQNGNLMDIRIAETDPTQQQYSSGVNEECEDWGSCGLPSDGQAGTSKDIPDFIEEECEDWGSCGLPSDGQAGTSKDIPDVLGEDINDADNFVGMEDEVVVDNPLPGEVQGEDFGDLNNMSLEDLVRLFNDNDYPQEMESNIMPECNTKMTENKILVNKNELIEMLTDKIYNVISEARVKDPEHIPFVKLDERWFPKRGMQPFSKTYRRLLMNYEDLHSGGDTGENGESIDFSPEDINDIWHAIEKDANKIIKVITRIQQNKHINVPDDVLATYKGAIDNNPEAAQELLNSVNSIKQLAANKWDEKYAQKADTEFNKSNDEWNAHKSDLGMGDSGEDEIEQLEKQDKAYYGGGKKRAFKPTEPSRKDIKKIEREFAFENKKGIKEETTTLNDFGKHPGYRKKPMDLPKTDDGTPEGYKDWNDESAKSEEPFGKEIGSSAPYELEVKMLVDSVMKRLQEISKKKR